MYQQQTATVHIFLKVSAMDSLVFFSEYISRTAILTQASEITLYIELLVLVLHVQPLLFHFSKINMKTDQCPLLMVSLLNLSFFKAVPSNRMSFYLRSSLYIIISFQPLLCVPKKSEKILFDLVLVMGPYCHKNLPQNVTYNILIHLNKIQFFIWMLM